MGQPTTTLNPLEGLVKPHADAHRREGSDPVIGDIIFHGSVTNGSDFTNNTETYADVTDFYLDITSKGGSLLIMVSGKKEATNTGASTVLGSSIQTSIDVDGVEQFGYEDGLGLVITSAVVDTIGLTTTSTQTWLVEALPGQHTVQVIIRCSPGSGTDSAEIYAGATMIIFEILPTSVN